MCRNTLPSFLFCAALAGACGASNTQVKEARDASYKAEYHRVWATVLDAVNRDYEIHYQDEKSGVIETKWKRVEVTAEASQDPNGGGRGALFFRAQVVVRGGPPWTPVVDGVAGELKPGLAVLVPFKHGVADEPPWVEGRIDSLYVEIHDQLKDAAVYGVKPGPTHGSAGVATVPTDVDMPADTAAPPAPAPSMDR